MWRTEKKFRTGDTFSVYYKFPDGFVAEGKIEIYGPTKINTSEVSGTLWRYSTTEGRFFSDKSFGVFGGLDNILVYSFGSGFK